MSISDVASDVATKIIDFCLVDPTLGDEENRDKLEYCLRKLIYEERSVVRDQRDALLLAAREVMTGVDSPESCSCDECKDFTKLQAAIDLCEGEKT